MSVVALQPRLHGEEHLGEPVHVLATGDASQSGQCEQGLVEAAECVTNQAALQGNLSRWLNYELTTLNAPL